MDQPLVVAASRDLNAIFKGWRKHAGSQILIFIAIAFISTVAMSLPAGTAASGA